MKKYTQEKAVKKLIEKFPDAIVNYYGTMDLDFVSTVDRFADRIMEKIDPLERIGWFGKQFNSKDECARHIATYLFDLNEACQKFLDEHYYEVDGEIYKWDESEEDDEDNDDFEF